MNHDAPHHVPHSPYRAPPHVADGTARAELPRGDAAILGGVAVVGALPLMGVALGHVVEGWELGVGVLGVLLAGRELLDHAREVRRGAWTRQGGEP